MPKAANKPSIQSTLPELNKTASIHLTGLEEALIRNVHHGYEKVILEKEFGGGYSGMRVFLVLPVKPNGARDARVVTKLGPASELQREKENYDNHAGPALPFTATQIHGYYPQEGQAALNYIFAGGEALGKTTSLEEYYQAHAAQAVVKTLDGLLGKKALGIWYGQYRSLNDRFGVEYGRHLPEHGKLEEIVKTIFPRIVFVDGKRVQIPGVDGSYPDPLQGYPRLLDKTLEGRRSFVHGDLHPRNVLVDETGKGWLIDFAKVTERHNMFDFIKLETNIRTMALAQAYGAFSLIDYLQFERALNTAALGHASTAPGNRELAKAYDVICAIRAMARKYMGPEPDFRNEYFPALFLYALAMLKYLSNDGIESTRLVFLTSCSLGTEILEEREAMQTSLDEGRDPSEEGQARPEPNNPNPGTSNPYKVNQTDNSIKVGNITNAKNLAIGHGAQVNVMESRGASADEIAKAFMLLLQRVDEMREGPDKTIAQTAVQGLQMEAGKGEQAVEENVDTWFSSLAQMAPDIWDVAVDTFVSPIKGLSTVFQKIAKRAMEKKGK